MVQSEGGVQSYKWLGKGSRRQSRRTRIRSSRSSRSSRGSRRSRGSMSSRSSGSSRMRRRTRSRSRSRQARSPEEKQTKCDYREAPGILVGLLALVYLFGVQGLGAEEKFVTACGVRLRV